MKKSIKRNLFTMLAALSLTVISGETIAYFTDVGILENSFSVKSAALKVVETEWEKSSEEEKILYPTKTVVKDPAVRNTGTADMYVFAEVRIPMSAVKYVGDDETTIEYYTNGQLFIFKGNETWKRLDFYKAQNNICFVYGYKEIVKSGASTEPIFESINTVNYLEGSIEQGPYLNIPVHAFGIQSDFILVQNSETTDIRKIYEEYGSILLEQGGGDI